VQLSLSLGGGHVVSLDDTGAMSNLPGVDLQTTLQNVHAMDDYLRRFREQLEQQLVLEKKSTQ
jgi:hypothetical protein